MPNRIIKESICSNEQIDSLSPFEEVLFYRLIVNADDYGRFDGRTAIIRSRLFPLKNVRNDQIEKAIHTLSSVELVDLYYVGGKPFVRLTGWDRHQTIRAKKSKYPAPETENSQIPTSANVCKQMQSDVNKCPRNPIQSESESESESEAVIAAAAPVHRFGSDLSPSQIQSSLENDRLIEDAAKDWGLPCNPGNMVKARDLSREYSIQWLIEAMKRAGNGKSQTWAYVEGILRSFKANGGPDTPGSGHRVIYPEKRVSAQNYQQRQYTEAELMAVSGDLVAEARKLREEMPKARTPEEQAAFEAEQESDIAAFLQKEAGA